MGVWNALWSTCTPEIVGVGQAVSATTGIGLLRGRGIRGEGGVAFLGCTLS